jgi:hypothetical protein
MSNPRAGGGDTLRRAAAEGRIDDLNLLMSGNPSAPQIEGAFQAARRGRLDGDQRHSVFEILLGGHAVNQLQLSAALVEAVRRDPTDLDIPTLLLQNRADVTFNNAEALQAAIRTGIVPLVELLAYQHISTKSANTAFRVARTAILSLDDRTSIYRALSGRGISQENLNEALRHAVNTAAADTPTDLVQTLLVNGANANISNCALVFTAWRKGNVGLAGELVVQGIDVNIFVPELLKQGLPESTVYWWLHFCWNPPCSNGNLSGSRVLVSAIKQFPAGVAMVKLLLEHGCDAGFKFKHQLQAKSGDETVTVLLWALQQGHSSSGNKVSDDVILELLADEEAGNLYPVLFIDDGTNPFGSGL